MSLRALKPAALWIIGAAGIGLYFVLLLAIAEASSWEWGPFDLHTLDRIFRIALRLILQ